MNRSLIIRKVSIKIITRYCYKCTRMLKLKKIDILSVGKYGEQLEL